MSRRGSGLLDEVFEVFREVPLKLAVAGALVIFVALWFVAPLVVPGTGLWSSFGQTMAHILAVVLALAALAGGMVGVIERRGWRRLLDKQPGLSSIKAMTWQEFENLVAEAYRRRGYRVDLRGGAAPDGGVDLVLEGTDGKTIVQCKRWTKASVGVLEVRALLGVLVHEQADRAIILTTGGFTTAAKKFAAGKPIELMDGRSVEELVRAEQSRREHASAASQSAPPVLEGPSCPLCQRPMIKKLARQGRFNGQSFWGCSAYPSCRGRRHAA